MFNRVVKGKFRCKICGESCEQGWENCSIVHCIYCNSDEHTSISKKCGGAQKKNKETTPSLNTSFNETKKIEDDTTYSKITTKNSLIS